MKESQLKTLVKAIIREALSSEDGGICSQCNGSGEGPADKTICSKCKGSGSTIPRGKMTKRTDPDYDWEREPRRDDAKDWGGMDELSNSPFGMNRKDRRDLSKKLAATDNSKEDAEARHAADRFLQKTNPSAAYKIGSERQRKDFLKSLGAKVDEGDEADAANDMWAGSDDDLNAHGMGEPAQKPHLLNGQSNAVAASRVNKILAAASKGLYSDGAWEGIRKIEKALNDAGIEAVLSNAKYGGHNQSSGGMPTFKTWDLTIPFTNKAGRPFTLVGVITAHGAGTVENPLNRYDITAYVSPAKPKA